MDYYQPRRVISELKEEIFSPTVLSLYDVAAKTKISADASAYGRGKFPSSKMTNSIQLLLHHVH